MTMMLEHSLSQSANYDPKDNYSAESLPRVPPEVPGFRNLAPRSGQNQQVVANPGTPNTRAQTEDTGRRRSAHVLLLDSVVFCRPPGDGDPEVPISVVHREGTRV